MRSFGLVESKIAEAEYFLQKIMDDQTQAYELPYLVSAFVSAARSVTFASQASLKGLKGFDTWYGSWRLKLKKDELAKFFHEFRRINQHIGENYVRGGSVRDDGVKYWFGADSDLGVVPQVDVVTACRQYFVLLLEMVFDCFSEFGPYINGQQRYWPGFFETIGKTIEDAEEEFGLPRGHTDIGRPDLINDRWRLLRDSADGCGIDPVFIEYLGKDTNALLPKD